MQAKKKKKTILSKWNPTVADISQLGQNPTEPYSSSPMEESF